MVQTRFVTHDHTRSRSSHSSHISHSSNSSHSSRSSYNPSHSDSHSDSDSDSDSHSHSDGHSHSHSHSHSHVEMLAQEEQEIPVEQEQKSEAVVFVVLANLSAATDPCPHCWETGFELICRRRTLKFTFEPSTSLARVLGRFSRRDIGWRPAVGIYHNLTVILRSNDIHTYIITDGNGTGRTWRKDFRWKDMFPRSTRELSSCQIHSARQFKRLSLGLPTCYSRRSNVPQSHCLILAASPKRFLLGAPYRGNLPARAAPSALCKSSTYVKTNDGRKYNFRGRGTYILSKIATGDVAHTVQTLNCPLIHSDRTSKGVTRSVGMAVEVCGKVITYFNDTVKLHERVAGSVNWDQGVEVQAGANTAGCPKIDVGDGVLVVEGLSTDGNYVGIRATRRYLKSSPVRSVLDIAVQVPWAAFGRSRGLCSRPGQGQVTGECGHFVNRDARASLFAPELLASVESLCCADRDKGGCAAPCESSTEAIPTLEELCSQRGDPIPVATALAACQGEEACARGLCAEVGTDEAEEGKVTAAILDMEGTAEDGSGEPLEDDVPNASQTIPAGRCRNVRGESFDVFATGSVTVLQVPRARPGQKAPGPDRSLLVKAIIQPVNDTQACGPTVVKQVEVSGSWLQGQEPLIITPGLTGAPKLPLAWMRWMAHTHTQVASNLSLVVQRPASLTVLTLAVGKLQLGVSQRFDSQSGVSLLDLHVSGLQSLGDSAGGLLGLDSHQAESRPLPGCDREKNVGLSLSIPELMAGLQREEETGGLVSRFWGE